MRGFWKYAVGAYLALMLLGVAGLGSFPILIVLAVVAAILLSRRASRARGATFRLSWTAGQLPAPTAAPMHRFGEAAVRELERRFPEDPLESPPLVEILSAYTHEPAEARRAVEDEYRQYRRRFLAWRSEVEAPGAAVAAGRLEAEFAELERYLGDVDRRAEESPGLLERALAESGRADDALARARAAYARLAQSRPQPDLVAQLDDAEAKLRRARDAFAKDAERPVTALGLCAEVVSAAREVEERIRTMVDRPRELEERRRRFDGERMRVEQELARIKDEFQASAQMYPPSCWLEVRGAGAAADRAVARARARWASACDDLELGREDEAGLELDEAFESLARASELVGKIDAHLTALEAAALGGRERLADAETEIDRAWVDLRRGADGDDAARREEPLQRASELVARARAEIEKERPDWLAVTELAERSVRLARETDGVPPEAADTDPDLAQLLDEAKRRAKAARDSAWAWTIVSSDLPEPPATAIDAVEAAFLAASQLEAAISRASGRAERARAVNDAVDAYRSAERAATAAANRAEAERAERSQAPMPAFVVGRGADSSAEALVWGALGLAALLGND